MTLLLATLILTLGAADDPLANPSPVPMVATEGTPPTVYLSLPQALRAGLDRAETVRVLSMGAGGFTNIIEVPMIPNRAQFDRYWGMFGGDRIVTDGISPAAVGPHDADVLVAATRLDGTRFDPSVWRFKADAMAVLRTVEAAYGALWQCQVEESAYASAVRRAEEVIRRDEAEFAGTGGRTSFNADVAAAQPLLDDLRIHLRIAHGDRATAEKRLRSVIALPPTPDSAPIVAVTPPLTLALRPDLAQARRQRDVSEPQTNRCRAALLAATFSDSIRLTGSGPGEAPAPEPKATLDRLAAELRWAIAESDQNLDRCVTALATGARSLATTTQSCEQMSRRLAAQQAFSEEGRITVDRLVDAIGQLATATALAAQAQADNALAIVAFHEAQGTLLTHDGVNVVQPLGPRKAYIQAREHRRIQVPIDGSYTPLRLLEPRSLPVDRP